MTLHPFAKATGRLDAGRSLAAAVARARLPGKTLRLRVRGDSAHA
ncbi:hypothetical protein [Paracoccus sediminis]|nr:hypothetical protein [Paracoccus sediminis]